LKLLKGISGGLSLHQPYPISLFFDDYLTLILKLVTRAGLIFERS